MTTRYVRASASDNVAHEIRLGLDVALAVAGVSRRQLVLQCGVRVTCLVMGAQIVAEGAVIVPELAVDLAQVQVIRARLAAAEEVAPRNSLLAAIREAR